MSLIRATSRLLLCSLLVTALAVGGLVSTARAATTSMQDCCQGEVRAACCGTACCQVPQRSQPEQAQPDQPLPKRSGDGQTIWSYNTTRIVAAELPTELNASPEAALFASRSLIAQHIRLQI